MSHPARLSLRAPPHLPFIQGYPGIPGSPDRKQAAVCGTVEVRVGATPIKAKWVRIEIRKHECLPTGFNNQGESWELIGEIMTLWSAQNKEFDNLETADFKFFLPLPETIPSTVEMMKGTGVWYELVAALSYRKKGGIFKSDAANIMKVTEPLRIIKHELHSAWPVYGNTDQKSVQDGDIIMTVQRPGVTFGPGDRILLTASLRSMRPIPFKLRGFECTLLEVVTALPPPMSKDAKRKSKTPSQPIIKSRQVAQARCAVDESVGRGGEKSARIDMAAPNDLLVTVRSAKTMEIGYELRVKAVCDGFEGPVVAGIKYVVGPYNRPSAQQAIKDIGYVEQLCPAGSSADPSRPTSSASSPNQMNGFATPPNGAPQGFPSQDWRRKSSSTTTTTTVTERASDMSPGPAGRPYSTMPNRASLAFPVAHPVGGLQRAASTTISEYSDLTPDERYQSETSHNRMSAATFGPWDKGLKSNITQMPASPNPDGSPTKMPQAWDAAEREKLNLFNSARQAAAANHQSAGVPLDRVGLANIPDTEPPEYTPPAPPPKDMPVTETPSPPQPAAAPSSTSRSGTPQTNAVDATTAGVLSGQTTSPSASREPNSSKLPPVSYPSGLSEKEQMRRYYEARDQVERAARGEGSSQAQTAEPTVTRAETPTSAAASRATSPGLSDPPVLGAIAPVSPLGPIGGSAASASTSKPPQAYPSAEEEKALMKKRYEDATNRVARAVGVTSPVMDSPPAFSPPPAAFGGLAQTASSASAGPSQSAGSSQPPPARYLSAEEEKEQMRRRYEEANQRVAKAQGRMSLDGHAQSSVTSPIDRITSPPVEGSSSAPRSVSNPTQKVSPAYMSAEQEKEMMRKRYEDANAAVSKARQSLSASPVVSPSSDRAMSVASPISPAAADLRKPAAPAGPPPLPAKPPAEYINLLSPVSETASRPVAL